jgi:hypothetical protein
MSAFHHALRGDKRRAKLDALQDQINAALSERERVDAAPFAVAEVKERLKRLLPGSGELALRTTNQFNPNGMRFGVPFSPTDPLNLHDLCWLFGRDQLVDLLCAAAAKDLATQPVPIDATMRKTKLKDIDAQLAALQRDEEIQVLALFDSGLPAVRREAADPKILLATWQSEG